jgi:beta-1,4-mannosyl-glycoprotein beta-1,4-N-acetylglucosaminyltransferase
VRSALDRFLLAFKRERLNADPFELDRYIRLYWDDSDGFRRAMQAAWEARQPGPFISLCRVLELNGQLGAKEARRLAWLQLHGGLHREALETLQDPRFGLLRNAAGRLEMARALLGLGQLRSARSALARAVELDAGVKGKAAGIGAQIEALRAAGQGGEGWSDARQLVDQCLDLDAPAAAAQAMRDFLRRGGLGAADLPDLHDALDTVVSLIPPSAGANLLRALERIYPGEEDRSVLRLITSVLAGEDDEAAPDALREAGRDLRTTGALAWARAGKLRSAIPALGQLSLDFPRDPAVRYTLARAVGCEVLATFPLRLSPRRGARRIFDVFPFNDELRMLRIKLHEMAEWVDRFVLVEARQTFTGAEKPLVFQQHRAEFSAFDDKIIHVVVDAFPAHVRFPWAREFYQRDMGAAGLAGLCAEDDLVIISDADEVISGEAVKGFSGDYARLAMERARFFLNYREALAPDAQKDAASLWRASYLSSFGLSYARNALRADKKATRLTNAGWHFTSIADSAGIAAKLKQGGHQEYADIPEARLANRLRRVRQGKYEEGWERFELDERFPAYIRERRSEFEDVLI